MNISLSTVVDFLRGVDGILHAKVLTSEVKVVLLNIEASYSKQQTAFGVPINKGMFLCLNMPITIALVTNSRFQWPPGPYSLIYIGDTVIGEMNEHGLCIFKDRVAMAIKKGGKRKIVFLPLKFRILNKIGIRNAIMASPSPPSHEYLINHVLKVHAKSEDIGTAIIGIPDP